MYKVGVVKLTSCSGCICEIAYAFAFDDILSNYNITYATILADVEEMGDVDVALIEGSVSSKHHEELVKAARAKAKFVVAVGTCAVLGGIQSLREGSDINTVKKAVYPNPEYIDVYDVPKPVADVINVDFALPGCPINGDALALFLRKYALGGLPVAIYESVCAACKRKGLECVVVSKGIPCLGPVTNAGCGALCPSFGRGCYGCYGLKYFDLNKEKLETFTNRLIELGMGRDDAVALLKGYGFKSYSTIVKGEKR
jgi:coenzyme F420-reducing hydrogenase gamma subunit